MRLDSRILNLFKQQLRLANLCSCRHKVETAEHIPGYLVAAKHLHKLGRHEWEEGFESYREVGAGLDSYIENCCSASHIRLGHFPRLCFLKILVAGARHIHSQTKSLAEMERVERLAHLLFQTADLLNKLLLHLSE